MNTKNGEKLEEIQQAPAKDRQVQLVVSNCNVILNFPTSSENSDINAIKQLILNSVMRS
jgi:hypothetical protein